MGCVKSRDGRTTQVAFPKDKVLYNKEVHTKRKFFTGIEAGKGDIGMAGHLQVAYNIDQTVHYDRVNGKKRDHEFEIPPDPGGEATVPPIPSVLEVMDTRRESEGRPATLSPREKQLTDTTSQEGVDGDDTDTSQRGT